MSIVLFEDDQVGQLDPLAIGRPAFAISCGSYRLIGLLQTLGLSIRPLLRKHLRETQWSDYPAPRTTSDPDRPTLWVNARVAPTISALNTLKSIKDAGRVGMVRSGRSIATALIPQSAVTVDEQAEPAAWGQTLAKLQLEPLSADLPMLDYPHDVLRYHTAALGDNLQFRLAQGGYEEIADGLFSAPGAKIGQHVITDTHTGPILLDHNASVGPYSFVSGPAYLGPNARVIEHASIKDGVALGHTTKIGGEIEASIVEPYSNKQHHGFLGHSYLGSWVNLGAGSCNSDLKNTYGKVNMEYRGQKVATGMQFVGCFVGDYAKTAINTGIFTGKTIGVCSMVYGFVTTNVPSFVNYARSFGQVTEAPVEVMIATQARMFTRRGVQQRACDIQLLRDMYELTRHERELAGKPLTTDPLML